MGAAPAADRGLVDLFENAVGKSGRARAAAGEGQSNEDVVALDRRRGSAGNKGGFGLARDRTVDRLADAERATAPKPHPEQGGGHNSPQERHTPHQDATPKGHEPAV